MSGIVSAHLSAVRRTTVRTGRDFIKVSFSAVQLFLTVFKNSETVLPNFYGKFKPCFSLSLAIIWPAKLYISPF